MKQTNLREGCNFEVITFDYISIFLKKCMYFKSVSKICSTKYDFNIPDLLGPKPLIMSHDSLLPSTRKHFEKFTILTDQIIHTLKNGCILLHVIIQ